MRRSGYEKKCINYYAGVKAGAAPEFVKGERAVPHLSAYYDVRPSMIHQSKRVVLDGAVDIFQRCGKNAPMIDELTVRSLYGGVGCR